jgi:hypothetical protein
MTRKPKRPRDTNQLAKFIVDLATEGKTETLVPNGGKDPLAVELGRRGGLKGGKARDKNLSSERKQEIAKAAAFARWKNKK